MSKSDQPLGAVCLNPIRMIAFKYFLDMSKKQVIDEDILKAILQDAGVEL